jgi:hypothetical protein
MDGILKQSTTVTVQVGPFVDATDGVTPEVALGSPGIELSKAGAVFGARSGSTIAHDAEGYYRVELDATDTNTLGILSLKAIDSANHVPVWHHYMVVHADVYTLFVSPATMTEPSPGAPPTNPTALEALIWLWCAQVNKLTSSNTFQRLHNQADTEVAKSPLSTAAGVFTRDRLEAP